MMNAHSERFNDIVDLIRDERERQIKKWGIQNHPDGCSESRFKPEADRYKLLNDIAGDKISWRDILFEEIYEALSEDKDKEALKVELTQCCAVLIAWLEDLEKRP